MRMLRVAPVLCVVSLMGCSADDGGSIPALGVDEITALLARSADARPLQLNHHALVPVWTVSKDQEMQCAGRNVAGGLVGGRGSFTHLGNSSVEASAAWDVGNLITTPARYTPEGPAGGPVAPVLGQSSYPYAFSYDPDAGECGSSVVATGEVVLMAANGDRLFGAITGGEAHRLDFILPGDGVETFSEVFVTGGTGRFSGATGSFVMHTIARMLPTFRFAITRAEVLPGGTLGY